MERSPFLMEKLTISMAIFNSYVELPEGTLLKKPTVRCGKSHHFLLIIFPRKPEGCFPDTQQGKLEGENHNMEGLTSRFYETDGQYGSIGVPWFFPCFFPVSEFTRETNHPRCYCYPKCFRNLKP